MKKYFVCSDIHSFYTDWMNSLLDAGFELSNEDHILIILGDIFDRGEEPVNVYNFIKSLPKERRILIRGNHEDLLLEAVEREEFFTYDTHNGTEDTIYYLAGLDRFDYWYVDCPNFGEYMEWQQRKLKDLDKLLFHNDTIREIVDWINSDEWLDYYETKHYLFVHSFFPLRKVEGFLTYNKNWRKDSTKEEIEESRWGCPYKLYKQFWKEEKRHHHCKGKKLVCGHWHTSDFYKELDNKLINLNTNPIYKSDKYNIIGLDTCTVLSHKVNILVLNENEL